MKILVISPVYALSGVPLAQLRLANSLSDIGHKVDLIYGCKKYHKIEKSKKLNIIFFNKVRVLGMFFSLIKYLILNRPEVIFSAEDHLNAVVVICCLVTFSNAKIIVSSRVTPLDTYKNEKIVFSKSWFLKKIFPLVNLRANVLTCVSKDMVRQYKKIFKFSKQVHAYNIIYTKVALRKMKEKINHKWMKDKKNQIIVASGTLAEWKCFDYLIETSKLLDKKKINFKLIIIGNGPDKVMLNDMIKSYKLAKNKF